MMITIVIATVVLLGSVTGLGKYKTRKQLVPQRVPVKHKDNNSRF